MASRYGKVPILYGRPTLRPLVTYATKIHPSIICTRQRRAFILSGYRPVGIFLRINRLGIDPGVLVKSEVSVVD